LNPNVANLLDNGEIEFAILNEIEDLLEIGV